MSASEPTQLGSLAVVLPIQLASAAATLAPSRAAGQDIVHEDVSAAIDQAEQEHQEHREDERELDQGLAFAGWQMLLHQLSGMSNVLESLPTSLVTVSVTWTVWPALACA